MLRGLISLTLCLVVSACGLRSIAATITPKAPKPLTTIELLALLSVYWQAGDVAPDFVVPGDSHIAYLPKLEEVVQSRGLHVTYSDLGGYYGMTDGVSFILVERDMSANARVSTLLHEYAHVLGCAGPQKLENEVCAESASFLAARQIGLDTRRESFNYILLRAPGDVIHRVLWRERNRIPAIVATITSEVR